MVDKVQVTFCVTAARKVEEEVSVSFPPSDMEIDEKIFPDVQIFFLNVMQPKLMLSFYMSEQTGPFLSVDPTIWLELAPLY